MDLSVAVTTHNEGEILRPLFEQIVPYIESEDGVELVILDDYSDDAVTQGILKWAVDSIPEKVRLYQRHLGNNFAEHKNFLNSRCEGKYIFQIDGDEQFGEILLEMLTTVIEMNIDLLAVARVNIVNGLTDEDITKWKWSVDDRGWVMFPDWQTRLYKNIPEIHWSGGVHERIEGYSTFSYLPKEELWAIYHIKDIERQRTQNEYYETIMNKGSSI